MRIDGTIIFAFSVDDENKYHVYYDGELAEAPGYNRVVGAVYRLMKENPHLIDQFIQVSTKAAEELCEPFNNLLNERPSEN